MLLLACMTSACVTVHIHGTDARVAQGFGVVNITPQPANTEPVFITTQGVGMMVGSHTATLGYLKEDIITFPAANACHAVLIVENAQQFDNLRQLLASAPERFNHICMINKEKKP